ncbi:MAG TPA: hypothetical protein VFE78_39690 [Gemmataceae bacterium]|nr:hypothetical protein [Gemmataceae bacterium]
MRPSLAVAALFAAGVVTAAPAPLREDYEKKAKEAPWLWSDEGATPEGAAKRLPAGYRAEVEKRDSWGGAVIHVVKDGNVVHYFDGHLRTVFAVRDDVLYYADYHPSSSGCAVMAYDLRRKKQLWKTHLKGLGGVDHSKYHNAVNLDLEKYAVCVRGKESFGNYIEYVDPRTGKTVGHKVYPRK